MKLLLPLLALTATTLSAPTRNAISVEYTANYPAPPAAHPQRNADALPEDPHEEEDVPSPTNIADPALLGDDLDEILSVEKPLPSSFLMAVPELRAKRLREAEAEKREDEGQGEGEAPAAEESRPAARARDVAPESVNWVADVRHACPFAAFMAVSMVALLACAIQRYVHPHHFHFHFSPLNPRQLRVRTKANGPSWRKPRGEIYLHVEKPQRSLSLRAEEMASA